MKKYLLFLIVFNINGYKEADLEQLLNGRNCDYCDLSGASLNDKNFQAFSFIGTNFQGADISGSIFIAAKLDNTDFSKAKAHNADFSSALLNHMKAHEADFSNAKFINTIAKFSDFKGSKLEKTNFFLSDLSNSNLKDTHISNAIFKGANLYFANIEAKIGCESLNELEQYENMYYGIMDWQTKYCCTPSCNGKIMTYDNPGSCPKEDIERCEEMARKTNQEIITILPY